MHHKNNLQQALTNPSIALLNQQMNHKNAMILISTKYKTLEHTHQQSISKRFNVPTHKLGIHPHNITWERITYKFYFNLYNITNYTNSSEFHHAEQVVEFQLDPNIVEWFKKNTLQILECECNPIAFLHFVVLSQSKTINSREDT